MTDFLQRRLAELADEVTQVDLHDRVTHAARVARRRRQVATVVVAAVAVVVVAVAVPLGLRGHIAAPEVGTTVKPSSPPASWAPTRPIRLVYAQFAQADQNFTDLLEYDLGQPAPKLVHRIPSTGAGVSVSPDGRKFVMITVDGLFVSNIDGTGKRKLRQNVDGQCSRDWLPDSKGLLVIDTPSYIVHRLDTTTGAAKSLDFKTGSCHQASNSFAVAPDAAAIAYYSVPPRVVLATIDGVERRSFDLAGAPRSFSPDGNLLILDRYDEFGSMVLDVRTGATTAIPGGQDVTWAYFTPDGFILLAYGRGDVPHEFRVLSTDLKELWRMSVPVVLDRAVFTGTFLVGG